MCESRDAGEGARRALDRAGVRGDLTDWCELDTSDRGLAWRVRLASATSPTVVVKQIIEVDGCGPGEAFSRFGDEWMALALLSDLTPGELPASRLLGWDEAARVLVLEDLGSASLADALLSPVGNASALVVALGAALGRMQALTIGRRARWRARREALGASSPSLGGWLPEVLRATFVAASVTPSEQVRTSLTCFQQRVDQPGEQAVLVHRDACPDNALVEGDTIRLIDFENAQFGSPAVDASFVRMQLPSCWCSGPLPDRLIDRAERAYRDELQAVFAPAGEDAWFSQVVLDGCCYWVLKTFHWWPLATLLESDEDFAEVTLRQRLLLRLDGLHRCRTGLSSAVENPLADALVALIPTLRSAWSCLPPARSFPGLTGDYRPATTAGEDHS